jgi:hypothetical protein
MLSLLTPCARSLSPLFLSDSCADDPKRMKMVRLLHARDEKLLQSGIMCVFTLRLLFALGWRFCVASAVCSVLPRMLRSDISACSSNPALLRVDLQSFVLSSAESRQLS